MKNRSIYLDVIRVIACVMIIAMHAPIPNTGLGSYVLSTDSMFTAPGVGLFVMVSGALLLPVNVPTGVFLKRRFKKIIGPVIFWTLFYFCMAPYVETVNRGNGIWSFLSVPFSPQFNSVLWFMYMLAGLYLLAPILSAWLKQTAQRELKFYLFLWLVSMCYPFIRTIVVVNESCSGILYYFRGYAGYFLLGYYLKNYVKYSIWKCLFLMAVPLMAATIVKIYQIPVDFYDMFWYLSAFVTMMCAAWFLFVKGFDVEFDKTSKWQNFIIMHSNCCFGIYLVHIFVMRSILWKWSFLYNIGGVMQILLVTLLTFVPSFIITWVISHFSFAEYIIGFRKRK